MEWESGDTPRLPGSRGEHLAQKMYGTTRRAENFYNKQMLNYLNERMQTFLRRQDMAFIATADAKGECDCSFRAGLRGYLCVLDKHTVIYPEYRGNGVMASVGNIIENPHIGMIFIDFQDTLGLHVNGRASVLSNHHAKDLLGAVLDHDVPASARKQEYWIRIHVEEAYIHCSKHIPLFKQLDKSIDWGTDDAEKKGGDAFKAKACPRPWGPTAPVPVPVDADDSVESVQHSPLHERGTSPSQT